jgi:hypothetical protein
MQTHNDRGRQMLFRIAEQYEFLAGIDIQVTAPPGAGIVEPSALSPAASGAAGTSAGRAKSEILAQLLEWERTILIKAHRHVSGQRRLVARLRDQRLDTTEAEALKVRFEELLAFHLARRKHLRAALTIEDALG